MRLFAALVLPDAMLAELEQLVPSPPPECRPVPPGRWHLTLAFFGEVDAVVSDALAAGIGHRLDRVGAVGGVRIGVRGGGVFHGGAAHLTVTGMGGDDVVLRDIANSCRRAGLAGGAPGVAGRQRFHPHLTVARCRGHARPGPAYLAALQTIRTGPWVCDHIALVESFLGPEPRYDIRHRYPLLR